MGGVLTLLRKQGPGFVVEVLVNFLAPLLIYDHFKPRLGEVQALILSSAPPIAWSLIEFARRRRVDALSILVLAGIALSLLAVFGGGSAKMLLLRERLVTAIVGLVFLASAAIRRPIIYQLAHASMMRNNPAEAQRLRDMRHDVNLKHTMTVLTVVWGLGLLVEAAGAASLVMRLSTHDYMLVSPIFGYGAVGALSLWTFLYVRHRRARAARAAAAAAAAAADAA